MDQHAVNEYVRLWDLQPVPMRPSKEGLANYRNVFNSYTRPEVLIFGGTPELADLAVETRAGRIVRFDISREILEGMEALAKEDWADVETLAGDWLEHRPDMENRFDCAACDGGPLFLQFPGDWESLFLRIHRYLKPGGKFVFKIQAHPPGTASFETVRDEKISAYQTKQASLSPEEQVSEFWHLVGNLWQVCFLGHVAPDGKIDKPSVAAALDATGNLLMSKFTDPVFREIAAEQLHRMLRCSDQMPVLEYLTQPELVRPILEKAGFEDIQTTFLPDSEPIDDYCIQLVATKPV